MTKKANKEEGMKLEVFDRLILLNILPKEGDFLTLKIVRQMREDLSFSEAEHKALQFVQDEGNVQWKTESAKSKTIVFGIKATEIIVDMLKKLDKEKKLKDEHFNLYEKFVIEGN